MKKMFLLGLLATFLIANQSKSQGVIALTTAGGITTIYNTFDDALANANNGDHIYLPGGVFNLTAAIKKGVNIIGAGHYPDSTVYTDRTIIQGNLTLGAGASNALIEGLYITGDINFNPGERSDNIVIRRCNVNSISIGNAWNRSDTARCYNTLIIHNVIRGNAVFTEAYGFTLKGNIINGAAQVSIYHGGLIENNIFLSVGNLATLNDLRNVTFKNNIFMNNQSLGYQGYSCYCYDGVGGTFGCTFLNNLFVGKDTTLNIIPMAAVKIGNVFLVNPSNIFANQSGTTFDYIYDYHLKQGSPGIGLGNDGTDVGIYGTSDPYKEGAVPANPHISFKDIPASTMPNGSIQVRFKVSAQDK
jgi:hypothetical protein